MRFFIVVICLIVIFQKGEPSGEVSAETIRNNSPLPEVYHNMRSYYKDNNITVTANILKSSHDIRCGYVVQSYMQNMVLTSGFSAFGKPEVFRKCLDAYLELSNDEVSNLGTIQRAITYKQYYFSTERSDEKCHALLSQYEMYPSQTMSDNLRECLDTKGLLHVITKT